MTMIANALAIHAVIVGPHDIPCGGQVQAQHLGSLRADLLGTWKKTLAEGVQTANRILDQLVQAAEQLAEVGGNTRHAPSGRVFQNPIIDRKFRATVYALPTSATLLANLAVRRLDTDWGDLTGYRRLSVADFSYGTGALLSAAYHAALTRFRHAGGDDSEIHRHMIEHSIIGTDIATPDGQRLRGSPSETVCLCRSS